MISRISHYRVAHTSLNTSKETTLYQSAYEELVDGNSSVKTEELYITSNSSSENWIPNEDNHSELYFSAVHELYMTNCFIYIFKLRVFLTLLLLIFILLIEVFNVPRMRRYLK